MHAPLGSGDTAQLVELRSCLFIIVVASVIVVYKKLFYKKYF
jgi:hypothetical protein